MKKLLFILLLFPFVSSQGQVIRTHGFYTPSHIAQYYVKNGGDDAADGLTDATAWEHHPWMSTYTGTVTLIPGDTVYLNRDDTFTIANPAAPYMTIGQNGTAGHFITTTDYGTGAKPVINISTNTSQPVIYGIGNSYIQFDNIDISHNKTTYDPATDSELKSGIYFGYSIGGSISHDWIITNCDIHKVPFSGIYCVVNGYNIIIGDTTQTTTAAVDDYSNHIDSCGYSGIFLEGRNPTTNISNFKVYYNYIHDIRTAEVGPGVGKVAYGIKFAAKATSDGHPSYCYARYNNVQNVKVWEGLDCHGGSYIYFQDNYVYNCHISVGTQAAALGEFVTELDSCYVERNILENNNADNDASSVFIQMDGNDADFPVTNGFIRDNTLFYTTRPTIEIAGYGISSQKSEDVIIDGNYIYNGPTVNVTAGAISIGGDDFTISNNYILNWGPGIFMPAVTTAAGTCSIHSNIIKSIDRTIYSLSTLASGCTLNIYNNTLSVIWVAAEKFNIDFINMTVALGSTLNFKNNIVSFLPAASNGAYIYTPGTVAGTVNIDYNDYWNNTYTYPFQKTGVNMYTFANWLANTTYDDNSVNADDPEFTNGGGSYLLDTDFGLGATSSALNIGVNTGITTDYFGNARVGNYDIGAVEKQ